jgi:predicted site-specific integrase-resolvase
LEKCSKEEWHTELIKDIGSGLDENRKGFKKLIKMVSDGKVKRIVVEYKDRLMRFGLDTFLSYCSKFGTEVLILQDQKEKAFEEELAEDMVALVTSYSARLYGRRGGRKRHV